MRILSLTTEKRKYNTTALGNQYPMCQGSKQQKSDLFCKTESNIQLRNRSTEKGPKDAAAVALL